MPKRLTWRKHRRASSATSSTSALSVRSRSGAAAALLNDTVGSMRRSGRGSTHWYWSAESTFTLVWREDPCSNAGGDAVAGALM